MNILKKLDIKLSIKIFMIIIFAVSLIGSFQLAVLTKTKLSSGAATPEQVLSFVKIYGLLMVGVFITVVIGLTFGMMINKEFDKKMCTYILKALVMVFLLFPGYSYFSVAIGLNKTIYTLIQFAFAFTLLAAKIVQERDQGGNGYEKK